MAATIDSTTEPRPAAYPAHESSGRREPVRVAVVGATGYAGGELVRLLERHPLVQIVGLQGRGRNDEPIERSHAHLGRTGHVIGEEIPDADAVFFALPHAAAAAVVPELARGGTRIIDLGPDFRLHDPADYPRWYRFEHPAPELLVGAVYGLPELHRDEIAALRGKDIAIVGAPGCFPTTTILALAPLARAGLIGDLVVDAKTGVSGAGRDPRPDLTFSEVNESVRAYGLDGHRHTAEIEQELAWLSGSAERNPGVAGVDFVPHLVPMTRGIFSTCHVRPTRPVTQHELDELYRDAYADEPFVEVSDAPVATGQVLGSNYARLHVTLDDRSGRIRAIGVTDNLVKGAAGQAVQCLNVLFALPETLGLEQLPLAP
jgi:N-acetyl-gamma-glutamyl-phosphate reductase